MPTGMTGPAPLSPEKAHLAHMLRHQHIHNQFIGTAFDDSLTLDMRIRALQQIILDNLIQMQGPTGPQGPVGATGPQGPQGIQGPTGPQGDSYIVFANAYGAKPDGTDAAPGINAAIQAVSAAGGGAVYIANGTYSIMSKIFVLGNVSLIGLDKPTLLRRYAGQLLQNGDQTGVGGYNGNSNITIRGIKFDMDGQNASYPIVATNLTFFSHARNILIEECEFHRVKGYHSIDVNGIDGLIVRNCIFNGFALSGDADIDAFEREAIQLGSAQSDPDGGLTDYTPSKNVIIEGNLVRNTYSSYTDPTVFVGNHFSREGIYEQNIIIQNNIINVTTYGIRPFKWRNILILNNQIFGGKYSIMFSNVGGGNLQSSLDLNGNQTGITRNSDYITVANNLFDLFTDRAIQANGRAYQPPGGQIATSGAADLIISNNIFYNRNTSTNGVITMGLVHTFAITNNTFRGVDPYRYMSLNGCSRGTVNGNVFTNNTTLTSREAIAILPSNSETFEGVARSDRSNRITIMDNTNLGSRRSPIFIENADYLLVSGNWIQAFGVENDGVARSGVSVNNCTFVMIEGNMIQATNGTPSAQARKTIISNGSSNCNSFNNAGTLEPVVNNPENNNFQGAWDAPATAVSYADTTLTFEENVDSYYWNDPTGDKEVFDNF